MISNRLLTGTDTSTSNILKSNNFHMKYGTLRFKARNSDKSLNVVEVEAYDNQGYKWSFDMTGEEFHDYYNLDTKDGGYTPISKRWEGQAPGVHYWSNDNS